MIKDNKYVDNILIGRNIIRLNDIDVYTVWSKSIKKWKCLIENCLFEWEATPYYVLNMKRGCAQCYKRNKAIDDEIIDNRLREKNLFDVIRISSFINTRTKITWRDDRCGHTWDAKLSSVLGGLGCPKCISKKFNNEIIDDKIKNKRLIRIDNYIDMKTKIRFKCLNDSCQYIWNTTPDGIINKDYNCPKCSNNIKLTNQIIDDKLIILANNVKRISEYAGSNKKNIYWQCLNENCNFTWQASPYSVLCKKTKCPECYGTKKYSEKEVDDLLVSKLIKRNSNYINYDAKMEFECLQKSCGNLWKTSFGSILSGTGCPACRNKNEKIILNFLKSNAIDYEYQFNIKKLNSLYKNCRLDFYFPGLKLAIEYNGNQHYHPVRFGSISNEEAIINFNKQKERDKYVKSVCANHNINLIEIDGRDYFNKNLIKQLQNNILPILKGYANER